MNQGEGAELPQTQSELLAASQQQLQAELDEALLDLEDNERLRSGFLGQTGVHIGSRLLRSAQWRFAAAEARLKERIAVLRKLLEAGEGSAEEGDHAAEDQATSK